ncbi:hypothetical protein FHR81_003223 [Actinoalloteichus hoggarensis]|uniref:Uncharacterized protein n=1 Tax=Actinoalloteichus hoggarensis TaxID=1470176 RepID=A0A221W7S7_9PSEU|nr:hypothetical protein [Actinoalloteichus hoggarensis]ASO21579.1 hypothetical protein AHOG_19805 [Actinoalloteichus hoggarensis]MBB5922171.1 hypothetical protein [Actinoalloteichus hoggarensis]
MMSVEALATELFMVQADLPIAEVLAEADRIDGVLQHVAILAQESRNPLLRQARDGLTRARDSLRRTAGHWGAVGNHIDEYVNQVLGLMTNASVNEPLPPQQALPATSPTPPTGGRPTTPTGISDQKQNRHVLGTHEHAQRRRTTSGSSCFFDREEADRLCYAAWHRGTALDIARSHIREYDFGRPVGVDHTGRYQSRVRAHLDHRGRLHGHPCGPPFTRDHKGTP